VAENQAGVVGYIMARISGEEGEILNLAVLPRDRRKGIARRLLAAGMEALVAEGVREAYLEVRESNVPAITLYRSAGFRPVGLRPDYYRNPPEDALVLRAPVGMPRD
jgi:ribosomal-protein-alanine N-acetyltransferase